MSRQTVSLCIPTHGRPRYLLEALESGLAQTRLPDEIVVSDDTGSEETRAQVSAFAQRASFPVRYVHCATGQGQANNMNSCLLEAACDLILMLHDDDLLMPRAVELLTQPFEEGLPVVGTFGKQIIIDDEKEMSGIAADPNRNYRRTAEYAGLQADGIISGITQQFPNDGFLIKAAVARQVLFRSEYKEAADFEFGIRMGQQGTFYFVDEHTAKYRRSPQSDSPRERSRQGTSAYESMHILSRLLETHPGYQADVATQMRYLCPMGIGLALNAGRVEEASAWYFGPYHRHRILTPGGIRRGLWLAKAWVRSKFVRPPRTDGAP